MNILKTVKKIPGGLMVVPLLLGAIINTFFGGTIWTMFDGTFTTYLWKSGAMPILAVFIFCNATTINFKKAGVTVYKGVVITAVKVGVGIIIGLICGKLFGEAGQGKRQAEARMRDLLGRYGLADEVADLYPFELSGGMARRVLLLTALMRQPRLIIADEPTPGMDLALAKQAMQDFRTFADDGNGVLLITHDLELALEVADRIVVFYAGTTVEEAKVTDFVDETLLRHPYTRALHEALPGRGFAALPGTQPYVKDLPAGCPFAPRCADRREACDGEIPVACVRGGRVRCILYTENS